MSAGKKVDVRHVSPIVAPIAQCDVLYHVGRTWLYVRDQHDYIGCRGKRGRVGYICAF